RQYVEGLGLRNSFKTCAASGGLVYQSQRFRRIPGQAVDRGETIRVQFTTQAQKLVLRARRNDAPFLADDGDFAVAGNSVHRNFRLRNFLAAQALDRVPPDFGNVHVTPMDDSGVLDDAIKIKP